MLFSLGPGRRSHASQFNLIPYKEITMTKLTNMLVLFFFFFSTCALAQELSSTNNTKAIAVKATTLIGENKIKEGIQVLKEFWPIPDAEIENLINQTEMQWSMIEKRFGTSIAVDFVREEKVSDVFIRYLFVQKFENHAIRWVISFYKPKETWKVNKVIWDDQIDSLYTY